jgi:hypothetical protein
LNDFNKKSGGMAELPILNDDVGVSQSLYTGGNPARAGSPPSCLPMFLRIVPGKCINVAMPTVIVFVIARMTTAVANAKTRLKAVSLVAVITPTVSI